MYITDINNSFQKSELIDSISIYINTKTAMIIHSH